jgi:DNA-directed RNA polymerase subunit RPC12/RpoP
MESVASLEWFGRRYDFAAPEMFEWLLTATRQRVRFLDQAEQFEAFSTRCPYCGVKDRIMVRQATLVATGSTIQAEVLLHADGFDLSSVCDPTENLSTEDERVRCEACGSEFDLSDLTL